MTLILTPEELTRINSDMPSEAKYGEVFKAIAIAEARKILDAFDNAHKENPPIFYFHIVERLRKDIEQAEVK